MALRDSLLRTSTIAVSATVMTASLLSGPTALALDPDEFLLAGQNFPRATSLSSSYTALQGFDAQSLSGSAQHACVLDAAGAAVCWGSGTQGQFGAGELSGYMWAVAAVRSEGALAGHHLTEVSSGGRHTCGVDADGNAYCWGRGMEGQLGIGPKPRNSPLPVRVDSTGVLDGRTLTHIAAGAKHSCALDVEGRAFCWGANQAGQLGDGTESPRNAPATVDLGSGYQLTSITAGTASTCATTAGGLVLCWGRGKNGELGNGTNKRTTTPARVVGTGPNGIHVESVSLGRRHACGVTSDGHVYCWGNNLKGQLGDGTTVSTNTPVRALGLTEAESASAGYEHSCAVLSNGTAECWGANQAGRLGDGSTERRLTPVPVQPNGSFDAHSVVSITAMETHTCSIITSGKAYCWGEGRSWMHIPEQNRRYYPNQPLPVPVIAGPTGVEGVHFTNVTDGSGVACGISDAGAAYCWDGWRFLSGSGLPQPQSYVMKVDAAGVLAGRTLTAIAAEQDHACAVDTEGRAYCWGDNSDGQLGDGTSRPGRRPVAVDATGVLADAHLVDVASGYNHSCALDDTGHAYCWGNGQAGQLGRGSTTSSLTPVRVNDSGVLAGVMLTSIEAGGAHTCALSDDGRAFCWGDNPLGVLGSSTVGGVERSPIAVDTTGALNGQSLVSISVADFGVCALDELGRAYCWGAGYNGQLGIGTTPDFKATPVAVDQSRELSGVTLTDITTTGNEVCARSDVGDAYCWGLNDDGELAVGPRDRIKRPHEVSRDSALGDRAVEHITFAGHTWFLLEPA
jgi:alpha-tubulin suppressor-like RCC1 family protein